MGAMTSGGKHLIIATGEIKSVAYSLWTNVIIQLASCRHKTWTSTVSRNERVLLAQKERPLDQVNRNNL